MYRWLKWSIIVLVLASVTWGGYHLYCRPPFDADKVASLETRMWRAYYAGDQIKLGLLLISLLQTQHGLSFLEARQMAFCFARSAMKFRAARGDYEQAALPDHTVAYQQLRQATGATFDPGAVARADLDWWVARRTPGRNSTEQVGLRIGHLYALLYGSDKPAFQQAGWLRAQAAHLRDSGGDKADWPQIEQMLHQSYQTLARGLTPCSGD